ncbi:MAG: glycosyltransferase [Methanothrix sp.]
MNVDIMECTPQVSIITPTYNHENFIAQCIESVLAQTYVAWEQIIIDDGSSDQTGEIILRYNDDRIKYIRQEHKGIWRLSEAYNQALQLSNGDYIAILEGDDFWPPNKLEIQIKAFAGIEAVLSWGRAEIVDSQGNLLAVSPKDMKPFFGLSREQTLVRLLFKNCLHPCTIICRKSALLSIGGFKQPKGIPCVDAPTWLELSLIGEFFPMDEILASYRKHDLQVSSTMKTSMIKTGLYSLEFFSNLPESAKDKLKEEVEDIEAELKSKKDLYYYRLGRAYLIERNWQEARDCFFKAFHEDNPVSIKAKAVLGIIFSYCKIDMETVAHLHDKLSKESENLDECI